MFTSLFLVLLFDLLLIGVLAVLLAPLALYRKAAFAVLKRNFISYFTTPTGYVFLCLFVLLSSFAAFWPHDFFASNMATLDQLNFWIPLILLLFVPAITMSIWAEERRQGTDELLLTIPAGDVDIVVGKYLAAAAIFTASLLFSKFANFSVLNVLAMGEVDLGLFFATYVGYWFMGMAMLAVGMVASFLTKNLTVGFILGAVFNAPLALAKYADVIVSDAGTAQAIAQWGMSAQFQDFGRGVISISSIAYFLVIIAVGLYLSVVLIGRRHWLGGKDGPSLLGHFVVRTVALIVFAVSTTVLLANHDVVRQDVTSNRISSLSPQTYELLDSLEVERPIRVEAYISKSLPDNYVRTKYDLINLLKELQSYGGDDIRVAINDQMEPFSEEAKQAEDRYGIEPVAVPNQAYGTTSTEEVFLAAAISSGPERVVIPFFGPGTPIEYELIRSVMTVANPKDDEKEDESPRKKIGIMRTDAQITGGFNLQSFQQIEAQLLVEELRKQYDVEDVSPAPVDPDEYDALVVVQPSSLTPQQLPHVLDAIRAGIPTAVFEDPMPYWFRGQQNAFVPGTDQPKRPTGGMMGMRRGPQPKCEIERLWDLLGVWMVQAKRPVVSSNPEDIEHDYENDTHKVKVTWEAFTPIIWQKYNPYPKDPEMPPYVVFASPRAPGAEDAFNPDDPIVSGMHELLFMTPGAFEEAEKKSDEAKGLDFVPLVKTGTRSGLQALSIVSSPGLREIKRQRDVEETEEMMDLKKVRVPVFEPRLETGKQYVLAARITGKLEDDEQDEDTTAEAEEGAESEADDGSNDSSGEDNAETGEEDGNAAEENGDEEDASKVNVVLVADMDLWASLFVQIRDQPISQINYRFQNVAFMQNIIDDLVGEDRFISIRKRVPHHASLKLIEQRSREAEKLAEKEEQKAQEKLREDFVDFLNRQFEILQEMNEKIVTGQSKGTLDTKDIRELEDKRDMQEQLNAERREQREERNQLQAAAERRRIERELAIDKRNIQNYFKMMAVILPAIPPLLIAGAVFLARRMRESQSVSRERRR